MNKLLPLQGEELDRFFYNTYKLLKSKNVPITEREAYSIMHRVIHGAVYLTDAYLEWWKFISKDEIDFSESGKSPHELTLKAFNVMLTRAMLFSVTQRREFGFWGDPKNPGEIEALKTFWINLIDLLIATGSGARCRFEQVAS